MAKLDLAYMPRPSARATPRPGYLTAFTNLRASRGPILQAASVPVDGPAASAAVARRARTAFRHRR